MTHEEEAALAKDRDEMPDWMPQASAFDLSEGLHRFGSTGQLWVVRDRVWHRIKSPTPGQCALADNPR